MSSQHNPHKPDVRLHANVYSVAENVSNFTSGNHPCNMQQQQQK